MFGLGSLFGALADTSGQVIAARAIMGVGAAFVMPSTLSILTNVFPDRERAKAIAIWAGISGAGAAIGPLTSGLLLEHYWWGSVFLVNLPIVALALVAGAVLVPKSKDRKATPLDPVGALLSIVGLSALVYAIIEGPSHGWLSAESAALVRRRRARDRTVHRVGVARPAPDARSQAVPGPPLRRRLRRDHASRSSPCSACSTCSPSTSSSCSDYSPLEAAVRLLPVSLVMMAVAPQTPKLVARFGANKVASTGLGLVAVALALTRDVRRRRPRTGTSSSRSSCSPGAWR